MQNMENEVLAIIGTWECVVSGFIHEVGHHYFCVAIHMRVEVRTICLRTIRKRVLQRFSYWRREHGDTLKRSTCKGLLSWCHRIVNLFSSGYHEFKLHGITNRDLEIRSLAFSSKISIDKAKRMLDRRKAKGSDTIFGRGEE